MNPPVKHALIVSHPEPDSFTMAVAAHYAETVRRYGHEVVLRDLYRLPFNPVLTAHDRRERGPDAALATDVSVELAAIAGADVFVLVYPVWFGGPPAMIKGYVDRIFGARFTFDQHGMTRHPLFAGKRLVSLTTSASLAAWLDEQGALTSLRNLFETYLRTVFGFSATSHLHLDGVVPGLPPREYRMLLKQVDDCAFHVMADIADARCPQGVEVPFPAA
ncbi:NAD(P)H-dependent oxidoreductase [Parablastomonas sp. CN1-191]|uniref:NAD(P)H-dependent oxidoreductase n=1 Tax=Parablastomonas sp. CN1-191 TaxID=3400908 RepID=UPI003BF8B79F